MKEAVNWDTQAVEIAMSHSPQLTMAARKVAAEALGQMIAQEVWKTDKKTLIDDVRDQLNEVKPMARILLEERLVKHIESVVERFFDREMY